MQKTLVTPSIFKAVKILIDAGETYKKIADYMKLSVATIGRINQSETYEEYQTLVAEISRAATRAVNAKKAAEAKQEVKPAATQPQSSSTVVQVPYYVIQKLDKVIDLLTQISNKTAFIVEDLTK